MLHIVHVVHVVHIEHVVHVVHIEHVVHIVYIVHRTQYIKCMFWIYLCIFLTSCGFCGLFWLVLMYFMKNKPVTSSNGVYYRLPAR